MKHRTFASISVLLPSLLISMALPGAAQAVPAGSQAAKLDRIIGVYQLVPFDETVAGAPKAKGTLEDLPLTPKAVEEQKSADLRWDPATNCRIAGPFRMMAMPENRIELLPSLDGGLYMLFKNANVGNRRQFEFKDRHPEKTAAKFSGDSIAHWQGDSLVVDTIGFNDKTWLNGQGAPHAPQLHMTEIYKPVGTRYLELTVTVEDPGLLSHSYTYTRFYERQKTILGDYFCEEASRQN